MIKEVDFLVPELQSMKAYPDALYYKGNLSLLQRPKISIVGTRHPISYTKLFTQLLARKLSVAGVCIVSGGAQGVDAIAHQGAGFSNTIMVAGTGLDIRYPALHAKMIESIENEGLVLSQFEAGKPSTKWNFPKRNELVVALGDALIVTQADPKSGSMHSVEFALKMNKPIYVLPHRLGESEGTSMLLAKGLATPLYDIDAFVMKLGLNTFTCNDEFLAYCSNQPLYHEAVEKFANKVFEYECLGKITIDNGRIKCT
ncbi:DNA-processing protein DprA [Sulfurospirillum barnesii]|uniref:Putative Rossmann fold nucleotide-binding protein involved in DNA uptake n=1 Tax=Sulfurospirillum barnesii (strain ATCC 700032 / DSM 10660 / SES-3) TaxID=760154 RepID=I3XWA5_SULBS|nr:DNA-processing protein DprA [Sulfurospirillum barnesii]AFL68229.1 putative Rossmann fold nucleotide-binding protein involved in DNA uptake [Sulfurospirillum barnesii SES-3]